MVQTPKPETVLERYRRLAREIRKEVQMVSRLEDKRTLEGMAEQYEKLAAEEEARALEQAKDDGPGKG